ncbi:hypothetical protein TYRP_004107 [Tyrophagus putrescentiae]|nr:hypothetical protein TYRP_004107 [Tyrophagus putrescentiae]
MKRRGKRLSKKAKDLSSLHTKDFFQSKVVNSDENILTTVNDNIVKLPPPLTTTIDEIESGEDSISLNDSATVEENVVSSNENSVTIPLSTPPPEYLRKDPISSKFVFDLLDEKDYVKYLSWKEFNKNLSKLMARTTLLFRFTTSTD